MFKKAVKNNVRLRLTLVGPPGAGKSYTALKLASLLGGKVAAIDTEHSSMLKYADEFDFDHMDLTNHDPRNYIAAIQEADKAGYDIIVIDSLSHAWMGRNGLLEIVDNIAARQTSGNTFAAWKDGTPIHRSFIEAMLACRAHIITTMRSKTDYILTENSKGKLAPQKVGMGAVQRDGMEYEFDLCGEMNVKHSVIFDKTRCRLPDGNGGFYAPLDGKVFKLPGEDLAAILRQWLALTPQVVEAASQRPLSPLPARVLEMFDKLGLNPQQRIGVLAKRGAASVLDLTEDQCREIIASAEKRLAETTPAPAPQEPAAPPQTAPPSPEFVIPAVASPVPAPEPVAETKELDVLVDGVVANIQGVEKS